MRTVWKFEIPVEQWDDPMGSSLPGEVVHVEAGAGCLTVWCELDKERPEAEPFHVYRVFGTGHEIPFAAKHEGTVRDGMFVWHLYQLAVK